LVVCDNINLESDLVGRTYFQGIFPFQEFESGMLNPMVPETGYRIIGTTVRQPP
jgi:hypothetical protein